VVSFRQCVPWLSVTHAHPDGHQHSIRSPHAFAMVPHVRYRSGKLVGHISGGQQLSPSTHVSPQQRSFSPQLESALQVWSSRQRPGVQPLTASHSESVWQHPGMGVPWQIGPSTHVKVWQTSIGERQSTAVSRQMPAMQLDSIRKSPSQRMSHAQPASVAQHSVSDAAQVDPVSLWQQIGVSPMQQESPHGVQSVHEPSMQRCPGSQQLPPQTVLPEGQQRSSP
jgi:hypothetical protein